MSNIIFRSVTNNTKVALVTDSLVGFGGADRLLASLLKVYPDADIFTSVYDESKYPMLKGWTVRTSFIQRLPFHEFWKGHYVPLSPIAFEQFDFSEYNLVVSLSAGCAKGVVTKDDTFHVGIILTPPRQQWDGREERSGKASLSPIKGIVDGYLRVWDIEASFRPDVLVGISEYIKKRVGQVYRRDSVVVYPGIDVSFWKPPSVRVKRRSQYLVVSRLVAHKRIDLAVKACQKSGRRLIVVGEGPERDRLEEAGGGSVEFKGFVTDNVVRAYMQTCRALLFPGLEDFGLAPVEAMACGMPVVAYRAGGLAETVENGKTGVFFNEQTVDSMIAAMDKSDEIAWDHKAISRHASRFSESKFIHNFKNVLAKRNG